MEFLIGASLVFIFIIYGGYKLLLATFMWVCDPAIKHFEEKEERQQEFMDKVEQFLDKKTEEGGDI